MEHGKFLIKYLDIKIISMFRPRHIIHLDIKLFPTGDFCSSKNITREAGNFSLSDVLCDPIDLIWRKETPFEAMSGRTAPASDGFLAEVF